MITRKRDVAGKQVWDAGGEGKNVWDVGMPIIKTTGGRRQVKNVKKVKNSSGRREAGGRAKMALGGGMQDKNEAGGGMLHPRVPPPCIIDHFFWNSNLDKNVIDAGVIHLPENMSDHCPVYCKYQPSGIIKKKKCELGELRKSLPSWTKTTEQQKEDFHHKVKSTLENLAIPGHLMCQNIHCTEASHKASIDQLMQAVLSTIECAAASSMKVNDFRAQKPKIPSWNDEIEPFKENAYFWHAIWLSAGKPLNNHLHQIMKKTRNRYHLVIRKQKTS